MPIGWISVDFPIFPEFNRPNNYSFPRLFGECQVYISITCNMKWLWWVIIAAAIFLGGLEKQVPKVQERQVPKVR
jgi:hypothetical protein